VLVVCGRGRHTPALVTLTYFFVPAAFTALFAVEPVAHPREKMFAIPDSDSPDRAELAAEPRPDAAAPEVFRYEACLAF